MRAEVDPLNRSSGCGHLIQQFFVDSNERRFGEEPPRYPRLVRDHKDRITGAIETRHGLGRARQKLKLFGRFDEVRTLAVQHAVSVQEYSRPQTLPISPSPHPLSALYLLPQRGKGSVKDHSVEVLDLLHVLALNYDALRRDLRQASTPEPSQPECGRADSVRGFDSL